ncbi:MAG: integrase core domain-containing protein [Polyangiaceae bacterium]
MVQPVDHHAISPAAARDALRSRGALRADNALLRHQLIVLERSVPRPRFRPVDRIVAVALAAIMPAWGEALLIVQPATLLRWHRAGYRALWRWRSRAPSPRIPRDTVALIRSMAADNRLWGAERIRGELLKLGIRASKRTVQNYMRQAKRRGPSGPRWATFLKAHAGGIWACDFLQTYDLFFRPLFALVFIEIGSRTVRHAAATRSPSQSWVTQQLRESTALGAPPRFLLCDRDGKFPPTFDMLAQLTGIRVIRSAVRAPNMNAVCERFLGSLRRECLDHVPLLGEAHLHRTLAQYVRYHNEARPHQGLGQRTPVLTTTAREVASHRSAGARRSAP